MSDPISITQNAIAGAEALRAKFAEIAVAAERAVEAFRESARSLGVAVAAATAASGRTDPGEGDGTGSGDPEAHAASERSAVAAAEIAREVGRG